MTNSHYLGLDAGGSGTKWVLVNGQEKLGEGYAAPLTTLLLETASGQQMLQDLIQALPARPEAIFIGMPGLTAGTAKAGAVAAQLAHTFGLTAAQVRVEGDLDLAYRAHLRPAEGILVYAGTGSIAYAVGAGGEVVRAGGRGYRIGDEGGGSSIGRSALHWATDILDMGQIPQGPLAEQIALITGGLDWDTVRDFVYGAPGAAGLAKVAPAVTLAAELGDGTALNLLRNAAQSLAALAQVMQRRLGPLPVVATGGALRSEPLQYALRQALPDVQIQFRNHAETAANLARTHALE